MRGRFRVRLSPNTIPCTVIALTGAALAGIAVWLFCGTLRKEGPAGLPEASVGICALLAFAGLFLWIGVSQIAREIRTVLGQKRAYETGRCVYAVYDRTDDTRFRIAKRTYLKIAVLTYVDESGWLREVHSAPMKRVPAEQLRDAHIPVYIDNDDPDRYYIDLDSILKQR